MSLRLPIRELHLQTSVIDNFVRVMSVVVINVFSYDILKPILFREPTARIFKKIFCYLSWKLSSIKYVERENSFIEFFFNLLLL